VGSRPLHQSHWAGFLFLVPFIVLLGIHDVLGLSDAALLLRDQRDRDSQLFNFVMIGVFYAGVVLFVADAVSLANRGWRWLVLKLVLLVVYWGAVLWLGASRGGA
jgi:hypothetical protein